MNISKKDILFKTERSGAMATTTSATYITSICTRLFHIVPGTDIYNTDMGLNIAGRIQRPHVEGSRDSEYEQMILKQFMAYTDLVPTSVIAIYQNKTLVILLNIAYNNQQFQTQVTIEQDTLQSLIQTKTI